MSTRRRPVGDLARMTKMLEVAGRGTTPDGEALNALRYARKLALRDDLTFDDLGSALSALFEKDAQITALRRELDAQAERLAEAQKEVRRRGGVKPRRPSAWMAASLEEARAARAFPQVSSVTLRRLLERSVPTTTKRLESACETTARELQWPYEPAPAWVSDTQSDLMAEAQAALSERDEERCLNCLRAIWLLVGAPAAP